MITRINNENEYLHLTQTSIQIEELLDKLIKDKTKINIGILNKLKERLTIIKNQIKLYDEDYTDRLGDWMFLYSGERFWPLDPREEDIDINTIAHSLSLQCRFGGHCSFFYSVATHSVHVSKLVPHELRVFGLLHDAAEAYVQDIIRPVKKIKQISEAYDPIEEKIMKVIAKKFGFEMNEENKAIIKEADNIMVCTEIRDLFPQRKQKKLSHEPIDIDLSKQIYFPEQSEKMFLERFHEIH